MLNNNYILKTAFFSLIIQIIIGIIGIYGIFIPLSDKNAILTDILIMETVVQFIELSFYIWLVLQLKHLAHEVTYTRYFDWFLSTPIMLITTVLFMKYLSSIDNVNDETIVTVKSVIKEHLTPIVKIIVANFFMLLFGFLAEIKKISRTNGFVFGTFGLLYSFYTIYTHFIGNILINKILFYSMFIIWFIYGVAFLFPYVIKNTFYNFLDIFSKNFYGLFLVIFIMKKANYF